MAVEREGEEQRHADRCRVQLAPDGVRGKAYLVGPNFRALLKYNNSISYAVTVATLAGEIEGRVAAAAGEALERGAGDPGVVGIC